MTAPSRALPSGGRRSLRLGRREGVAIQQAAGNRLRRGIFSQAVHFDIRFADGTGDVHLGTLSEIPGGGSVAVFVKAGHAVRLVNTPGTQTVDTWCIAAR